MQPTPRCLASLVAVMAMMTGNHLFAEPQDLTRSNTVDRTLTYNLGATGLRGWIYTRAASNLDASQGRTTTASRQILVTHVGALSPAAGIMEVNDVILGVSDKFFADDARKSFGLAITEAEKTENKGILKLIRFRAGKTEKVQLRLRVMGSYSATAPYDCPKSKLILADACKALEKEPLDNGMWGAVNGLALMASGNPAYLPKVRNLARSMAAGEVHQTGGGAWDCGYKNVFLSEYYLLTGDTDVEPGIKALTTKLAKGQGLYGTFGHGFSELTPDGKLHGSIPPYGPVNQAGLIANLGIVMGKKCGVKDPEVDPAIGRSNRFFGYFVDKGAVPYGEHEPWPYHENNGKSALTALLFAVQGNQTEAAQFFAKMSTAAYANREYGHTGQGFSYLWGALGANVGGPAAAAAFVKEALWHLDLERRCDGSFVYDGGEQYGAGRTDDNTYYGKSSYCGLSPNATYVLTYSLPLKKLCITGKDANKAGWLSAKDVAAAVASGRFDLDRRQKSPQELVAAFGDWSPVVRGWAAEELAQRHEAKGMVPELIKMAEGKDAHARQGACEALGYIRSERALPVFIRLLSHEDRWLRFKAAQALKGMGGEARSSLPDILKAVAETAEPLQPIIWSDPVQLAHGQLAHALFAGPLADHLKETSPKLLYPAIRIVSLNADGMARATLRGYFENHLTVDDVQALAPDIFAAVKTPSPADRMFANEIRMGGFKALTKYHFKEGLEAGVNFAKTQGGHGSESRTGEIMRELVTYGTAARSVLPQLKELIVQFNTELKNHQFPDDCNKLRVASVEEAIKSIENATAQPKLLSIAPLPAKVSLKK
ncbi:MAG: DUF6288 domain-containing protein [bacterium]